MPPSYRSDTSATSRKFRAWLFPTSQLEEAVTYRSRNHDYEAEVPGPWHARSYSRQWTTTTTSSAATTARSSASGRSSVSTLRSLRDLQYRRPRVQTYSYAGHRDPARWPSQDDCTCYMPPQDHKIPSMTYEHHRCPRHPHRKQLPILPDPFTYPWSVQTFRPTKKPEYGYRQGQVLPPPTLTAPPFVLHRSKPRHPRKGQQPPPYSAPEVDPVLNPFLSTPITDTRLRRVDRRRVTTIHSRHTWRGDDVTPWDSASQVAPPNELSPRDSISQVAPIRGAQRSQVSRRPERAGPESERPWQGERRAAADTPRPRREADPAPPHLSHPSRRIFKGDYGQNNDDAIQQAKRRQLKTV